MAHSGECESLWPIALDSFCEVGMRSEDAGLRIIIDLRLGSYQGRPMQYHVSVEQLKEPEKA